MSARLLHSIHNTGELRGSTDDVSYSYFADCTDISHTVMRSTDQSNDFLVIQ